MAKLTKALQAEIAEAVITLKAWCPPGTTVYTILDHVSSSGMSRRIRVVVPYTRHEAKYADGWREIDKGTLAIADSDHGGQLKIRCVADHLHPNHAVGLVTGYKQSSKPGHGDGLIIGGCGMDMGFALVHHLSERLYGGERCDCGYWACPDCGAPLAARDTPCATCGPHEYAQWAYVPDCPKCKGAGNVIGTGYQCLGKGACPSNYHVNHRAHVDCPGEGGERCYAPRGFNRHRDVPADWPEIQITPKITQLAACITDSDGNPIKVCATCGGRGSLPNPEGPERFDLEHFDGYALRQRWL